MQLQLASVNAEEHKAVEALRVKQADKARQNHEEAMASLTSERIGLLQLEAQHGNNAAKIEAERLEIQQKYVQKQEQLLEIDQADYIGKGQAGSS